MTVIDTLIRLDGRISRKSFWIGLCILSAALIALVVAIMAVLGDSALEGRYSGDSGLGLAFNVALLLATVPLFLKRLHDLNHSFRLLIPAFVFEALAFVGGITGLTGETDINTAGWVLLMVYSIYELALLVFLGFNRGTDGPNDFGPDPLAPEEIPASVKL